MEEPRSKKRRTANCRKTENDFILDVNGFEFTINKFILEEEFVVLKLRLLYIPMEKNRLEVENENHVIVEKVLHFLKGRYVEGENGIEQREQSVVALEEVIQISDASSALDLACKWEGIWLKQKLFSYLERSLNKDTFYEVVLLAQKHLVLELEQKCHRILTQNFCQLCQDDRFSQLDKNKILSALRSPDFKTACWKKVFESVLSWTKHDDSRRHCFEELFACIELWNISPNYLETRVESNPLVKNSSFCLNRVQKTYREIYQRSEGLVILADNNELHIYYPSSKRFYPMTKQPCLENYWQLCGMLSHQCQLYLFFIDCSVLRLDLTKGAVAWTPIASLPPHYFAAKLNPTAVQDDMFALGCNINENYCERYSLLKNIWENVPLPALETQEFSVASVGAFIYIIGITKFYSEPSMEVFNPSDGTITFASPMNIAVSFPSTVVHERKIYAAGSFIKDQPFAVDIECLDTKTNIWTTILLTCRDGMSIIGSYTMKNSVCFLGRLENVESPRIIHTLSVPSTCDHLNFEEIKVADAYEAYLQSYCCLTAVLSPNFTTYDFIVKVGNKEFPAHKDILSLEFKYFEAMFRSDMIENRTGMVEMTAINSCVVRRCIDYAYNAGCPSFTLDNIEDFLHAAMYMQSARLIATITEFLQQHLSISTFPFMKSLSNKYGCTDIEEACDNFALINFKDIVESACLTSMEIEYLAFLLSHRKEKDSNELEAYCCILRWVKAGNGSRDPYFYDLFSTLDLAKLPESFVIEKIPSEALVDENIFCLRKVLQSLAKRRELYEAICLIDTGCTVFSPKLKEWKTIWHCKDFPFESLWPGRFLELVSVGEYFYGFTPDNVFKMEYRKADAKWTLLSTLSYFCNTLVSANGFIFNVSYDIIMRFDTIEEEWKTFHVSVEADDFSVVAVEELIYLIGGVIDDDDGGGWNEVISAVKCFNFSSETLEQLQPMLVRRCCSSAAHYEGKIFVSGGFADPDKEELLASAEFYDIPTDNWTLLPDMNFPRSQHFSCFVDGIYYAVGGEENFQQTMEYLDETVQDWRIEIMPDKKPCAIVTASIPYELFFHSENSSHLLHTDELANLMIMIGESSV